MEQNRMEFIEKGMVEFFRGMQELRESQKNTDAQILELRESQKNTDEQLGITGDLIRELRESQKNTDVQLGITGDLIRELRESQKKTDEQLLKLKESQEKTDEQLLKLKESQEKTDEQLDKTIKKLDRIGEQLGDLGIVQGKAAEDLFYRNVKVLFKERDMIFGSVRRNVKKKGIAEYDIVAADGDRVLVIEVKNRMEKRMVDEFLNKKIPMFKQVFPQYKEFLIMGGVGALVMQDDVGRYAEKKGLYVLTQSGDGGAMLANRQNFRAREFS